MTAPVTASGFQRNYSSALDALRMLAQRDLLSWWNQTAHLAYTDQRRLMTEPFLAIVQTYGEQAAYAAADYLFQSRSLDELLAGLEYPEVAAPVAFEQAQASYRYAMWLEELTEEPEAKALALKKLMGVTQRLITEPARRTVEMGVEKAGTRYARVPEPGACEFCLMLASRGAAYSHDTVMFELGKYHDNCRCVGIEVHDHAPLPRVNQDLEVAWREATKGRSDQMAAWSEYLSKRKKALQAT